jgi:choline dehydrogenase
MYDYVIVGAGSAGCVLAARLSADPGVRVLVLEAGGADRKTEIRIPAAFSKLFRSEVDWAYDSEPEDGLDGRRIYLPRGKVIGGSSSINSMIYQRGDRADFDAWGDGWAYDEVLASFQRAEQALSVEDLRDPNALSRAFVAAARQTGIESVSLVDVTQRRGRRWSAADAYLKPARKRSNLDVVTGALAERVLFEGRRATGVAYSAGGRRTSALARREVIVCAGAFNSPQLLMLSGVGPAEHLRAHGITVVRDLPGVGQNLQDHLVAPLMHATEAPTLFAAESPRQLVDWLVRRRGMLTSNVGEAYAFVRTREELPAPDLELIFAPVLFVGEGLVPPPRNGFTIGAVVLTPRSRGAVALRSADPAAAPVIRPGFLSDPDDLRVLLHGIGLARHICAQPPLAAWAGEELEPGPAARDDEAVASAARAKAHGLYHPAGTCRMGGDAMSVVDRALHVHGVDGLRVADASIMPTLVRGHTNATAIMIGERAAELVRAGVPRPEVEVAPIAG